MKKYIYASVILLSASFIILYKINQTRSVKFIKAEKELEFVIVIPSYNNKQWYKKNLDSVLYQDYSNYKVIYADDCSQDGTANLVEAYVKKINKEDKLLLIKNTTRKLALGNLYDVIHTLPPHVIVATLDGDDWFPHNDVLSYLNKIYIEHDAWLTYGQYKTFPNNFIGHCEAVPSTIISENKFRDYKWVTSALRTFYAGLFQKINKEDLTENGDFFSMTHDQAIMYPMLEMAGFHSHFISEVLYIYNITNSISDWRVNSGLQHSIERKIRSFKKYDKLEFLFA